jgi:hypothetical protein
MAGAMNQQEQTGAEKRNQARTVDSAGAPAHRNRDPGAGDLGEEDWTGAGLSTACTRENEKVEEALAGKTTAEEKEQPWRLEDWKQNDGKTNPVEEPS